MTATSTRKAPSDERPRAHPRGTRKRGTPFGRFLRASAGVDEETLAAVRPERHRYTALGGVVLGTAAMATFSMGLALSTVAGGFAPSVLLPAVGWGLFVYNLDRWLVTSSHGLVRRWTLLPRLVLAVLFGVIIAEPVVLWVFDSAIEQHIREGDVTSAREYEDNLRRCNPLDPLVAVESTAGGNCVGYVLNIPPASSAAQPIAELETQRGRVQTQLDALSAELTEVTDRYQREIQGEGGVDTTGRRGVGEVARGLETQIAALEEQRAPLQARLNELDRELTVLKSDSSSAFTSYGTAVTAAIDEKLAEAERARVGSERASEEGPGLLERLGALGDLTAEDGHVFVARWVLSGFLIAVDSLPVLVKLMSSKTSYDRLLHEGLARAERQARQNDTAELYEEERKAELRRYTAEQGRRVSRKQVDVDTTTALLDLDLQLDQTFADRDVSRDDFEREASRSDIVNGQIIPALVDEAGFTAGEGRQGWRRLSSAFRRVATSGKPDGVAVAPDAHDEGDEETVRLDAFKNDQVPWLTDLLDESPRR